MKRGHIRAGIGGWTFEPWRGVFYPPDLPQSRELAYAAAQIPTIEINGTFYRTQSPQSFAKWAKETPDGFVFSVKGPRYDVNRRVLAEAGPSIDTFLASGVTELGPKLGPLLWQFAPTKKFDADDIAAFIALLPKTYNGVALRHALEVRHPSFMVPEFIELVRRAKAAVVLADHTTYPMIADVTSDFLYLRLQRGTDDVATAYPAKEIKTWVKRAKDWAAGATSSDAIDVIGPEGGAKRTTRDVFVYFIHEGKIRAPAAAMAFMSELGH